MAAVRHLWIVLPPYKTTHEVSVAGSSCLSNFVSICCCVQNFMKIGWFFAEIWQYNNFHNGSRPPSWNCFTTIQDHPRNLCCWPQLPVKFHVNLIHRFKDIAIWIFWIFCLKCLFMPPKMWVLEDFGPLNVIIYYWDPQKAHPCVNSRLLSYQL